MGILPPPTVAALFRTRPLRLTLPSWLSTATSLLSTVVLCALLILGTVGPPDPLANLLPLTIWTGVWAIGVTACALFGDLWRHANPWSGLYRVTLGTLPPPLRWPERLGDWAGLAVLMGVFAFVVADPAPTDPRRLAVIVTLYWVVVFGGMALFGEHWRPRAEALSVLSRLMGRVSALGARGNRVALPGWDTARAMRMPMALACLAILAAGSFDGLKETFWWMGLNGINPLEFPGRSAVRNLSLVGLFGATLTMVAVFAATIALSARMGGASPGPLFRAVAPTVLPIAAGYHAAHYLVATLVEAQYLRAALGDPLDTGARLFGAGRVAVTTGFLNDTASVKAIWLGQAGLVVAGHVLSVLACHYVTLRHFPDRRGAARGQIPLAVFMLGYTWFGLWLLAAARGA